MSTAIRSLLDRHVPAGTVFDYTLHEPALGSMPLGPHLLPFALYGKFGGSPGTDLLDRVRGEVVSVGGVSVLWLDDEPGRELTPHLPLPSHRPLPHKPELRELLVSAIGHLAAFPPALGLFAAYIRVVALVELREDHRGRDSQITTSSFPVLPFCAFFSERSFRQLPPRCVSTVPSPRFLSENLYHEAIHQALTIQLLLTDVLAPDYDSATSPKVDIYWREEEDLQAEHGGSKGNQQWEIDRVLHAAVVYGHVLEYRLHQLADPTLLPYERALFQDAVRTGAESVRYLSAALREHGGHFTPAGLALVTELCDAVEDLAASAA
ncbi:hypothetical protein [Microbispora sp. H11081]|uniref:hypothetical protein n=1 Tax=Microbispora sp. H11081 TaxID=2729107 RepID=UPI001475E6D5|nr:hypothetical protein [Microbispora sp. H11081]